MYLQYFGFSSQPFSDTPDVRLFWEGHCSQLVFKSLLQGLMDHLQLQLVVAEPGLGKSVLCRRLLNSLRSHKSRYDVLFMPFPNLTVRDLLNAGQHAANPDQRQVLIIDEAQALTDESLQQLAAVVSRVHHAGPSPQIVLFAQPELDVRLSAAQISKRYALAPLTAEQTAGYIRNHLAQTGVVPETLLDHDITNLAFRLTGGVPRLINTLMRKSLLHAFEDQKLTLLPEHLRRAAMTTDAAVSGLAD